MKIDNFDELTHNEQWTVVALSLMAGSNNRTPDIQLLVDGVEIERGVFELVHRALQEKDDEVQRRAVSLLQDRLSSLLERIQDVEEAADELVAEKQSRMENFWKGD